MLSIRFRFPLNPFNEKGMPKKVLSRSLKVHDMGSFEMVVKINLHGTFNVLRLVAAHMAKHPADEDNER